MADQILKRLIELQNGQDLLRHEIRKGHVQLNQRQDELSQRLDELRIGQDELRRGQDDLRRGHDELRIGQDELRRELLGALSESNESVLGAVQTLYGAFHDLRGRVEVLERKVS